MENAREAEALRDASPIALAAAVADRVEIRDVRLIRCACHQSPQAVHIRKLNAKLHRQSRVQVDESKNTIAVIAHFEFMCRDAEQPADGDSDFGVSADFLVLYEAKSLSGLSAPNFQQFAELNGTYNAWPYWREFLHNTMSRMELKPFLLPVFRIIGAAEGPDTSSGISDTHAVSPTE
jgi:hypothetical protein